MSMCLHIDTVFHSIQGAFHVKCTQKRGLFDTPDSELNDFWYTGSPID